MDVINLLQCFYIAHDIKWKSSRSMGEYWIQYEHAKQL